MKDKNSFILYTDLISTIEKLPNEIAGKLFKIILQYVNDLNPKVDDLLLNIAFEPIKQQLKRDLVLWEKKCEKNKENGLLGGRPKNKKPPNKTQTNRTVISKTQPNPTEPKKADTDSDSVTVIVTDTNTKEEKKTIPAEAKKNSLHANMKKVFSDFFYQKTETEFYWDMKSIVAINKLSTKILFIIQEKEKKSGSEKKEKENYDEEILTSWRLIIENAIELPDDFLKRNFNPAMLNSKFADVIFQIKNKPLSKIEKGIATGNELLAKWKMEEEEKQKQLSENGNG